MMLSRHHSPIKYGFNPNKPPPAMPSLAKKHGGETHFSPSFDNKLWMFSRTWEPPDDGIGVKATLMILHGTVDHSGVYNEFAMKHLVPNGIAVFAMDMRGWGLSDGESLYIDNIDTFVSDVDDFYKQIHTKPKYSTIKSRFVLGKSLGGAIAAFTVAKYPSYFTGLIGLSGAFQGNPSITANLFQVMILNGLNSVYPKLPIKQLFDPRLIVSNDDALQEWRNDSLCCKDKVRVGYIVNLMRCLRTLSSNHDSDDNIAFSTIDVPMLMMIGTDDQVVTLEGHQLMLDKSRNKDKILKTYQGGFHNLLAEPTLKESVMGDIQEWVLSRV